MSSSGLPVFTCPFCSKPVSSDQDSVWMIGSKMHTICFDVQQNIANVHGADNAQNVTGSETVATPQITA